MKQKRLIAAALVLLFAAPAFAVFNERDLGQTLSVLRYELRQEYNKISHSETRIVTKTDNQHKQMIEMLKTCNELSLILYSQNQDFTFDITYALKEATNKYEAFNRNKMPYDEIITRLDLEIERYSRLVESLRRLPPQILEIEDLPDSLEYHNDSIKVNFPRRPMNGAGPGFRPSNGPGSGTDRPRPFLLDEQGQEDRDSCIYYAATLLKMYSAAKDKIVMDSEHYDNMSLRLKESYDYAQDRYKVVQKNIFVTSQDNYFKVIASFGANVRKAWQDSINKYGSALLIENDKAVNKSEWRGPMVIGFIMLVLICLAISLILSIALLKISRRFLKYLQTDDYQKHKTCLALFLAAVIFGIILMVAGAVATSHFFILASKLLLVFAWLLAAILLSLLIRLNGQTVKSTLRLYTPVIVVALLVICFRIIFIPNSVASLIFPPLLLLSFIWQLRLCLKYKAEVENSDATIGWITLAVFLACTIITWSGYVLLGIQIIIWWLFQISAIETITAAASLLRNYKEGKLQLRIEKARKERSAHMSKSMKGEFLAVTWLFDLLKDVAVPVFGILSIPFCIYMAADVFDLTSICRELFHKPFVNLTDASGNDILHLSVYKIVLVTSLFFVFKYVCYVGRALYRNLKIQSESRKSGKSRIRTNQINFTLANNVIGLLVWGFYIILTILVLRIPMGALSIIAAGLATGLGLAMKDILNNFIYGIQLMSGRLRVGDWVECDGYRGKVSDISYQSTQIELQDGSVMSFLNSTLFSKNFKNLTRNNSYEFIKICVGVSYGSDVEKVREILSDALVGLNYKDSYGRDVVDQKRGVTVVFDEFGDSSVNLAVKQFILVSEHNAYVAKAKETIYNALNKNGIEIPFPQRDIHVVNPR